MPPWWTPCIASADEKQPPMTTLKFRRGS
ncbi:uncharacterized protein G2W53_003836 [Senna tora]|uniref:Uncharacterized protein n=1 Tax=Senna tora TaxID=362788 RepID=A0A834X9D8_9FABA|nr:uncharacterized protein G2W53_003836 [Senna tora]